MGGQKRKRPWALQRPEPEKLCSVAAAPNVVSLPQITPSRQQNCFDCNGLRSIGHGRGAVCFCAVQGKKIRPDSPACALWPNGLEVRHGS